MASGFDILPAIDLRGGRVVRLQQGDFARETAFSNDPVAVARGFVNDGALWLHVVDLDGARLGSPAHRQVIGRLVAELGGQVSIEVAGGLRTADAVSNVLEAGATRAVVGTAALRDPAFAAQLVTAYGAARIAVALDVRDGQALGEGWRPGVKGLLAEDALRALADQGVTTFQATAIDRDGLLGGPDLVLLDRLVALGRGEVIASGGVSSIEDIRAVRRIGCAGAIVGRALYEGRFDVASAIGA